MPVTRAADRDQKTLARMSRIVAEMLEAVKRCLQAKEDHGDESHAG